MRGANVPPVERLTFQRVTLEPGAIVATVLNDGPDEITIAQVQVDDAFWTFTTDQRTVARASRTDDAAIPYPWVEGDAHVVRVLTSTGTPFEHEIAVAVATPTANARFLGVFTLIGLYVGVLPVAIGLLWFPLLSRLSSRGMDFLLALTVGLLLFLLVDGAKKDWRPRQRFRVRSRAGCCSCSRPAPPICARVGRRRAEGAPRQRWPGDEARDRLGARDADRRRHRAAQLWRGAGDRIGVRARRGDARHAADRRLHAAQHHRRAGDRCAAGTRAAKGRTGAT